VAKSVANCGICGIGGKCGKQMPHKNICNKLIINQLYRIFQLWWRGTPLSSQKNMSKEKLINRFKAKVSNRKRFLFARYEALISSIENASIIAEEINEDLGVENLVTVLDIYYCRRYFSKKKTFTTQNNFSLKSTNFESFKWTDPATISKEKLRSKFAEPED
jgi:hypothetical protein